MHAMLHSAFRELSDHEIELVSGGLNSSEDIVVNGVRYYAGPAYDPAAGNNGGDGGGGGGGGGGESPSLVGVIASETPGVQIQTHTQTCTSASGAAVQIASHVMGANGFSQLSATDGSTWNGATSGANLHGIEFSAVVGFTSDGRFGAVGQEIWTEDKEGESFVPTAFTGNALGIWHNHPDRGGEDSDKLDAYPSRGDWGVLGELGTALSPGWPGYDPSMWITDPNGVTREFKLSERSTYENMSNQALINDYANLSSKVRASSCGA